MCDMTDSEWPPEFLGARGWRLQHVLYRITVIIRKLLIVHSLQLRRDGGRCQHFRAAEPFGWPLPIRLLSQRTVRLYRLGCRQMSRAE